MAARVGVAGRTPHRAVAAHRGRALRRPRPRTVVLTPAIASAQTFTGGPYDLVTSFDCLHDMGDPLGAARHVRDMLAPGGTWMVVEPYAGGHVTDNLNPVGRVYYSFSTFLCVPSALSQDGGYSLGAQAGEEPLARLAADAGFARFRRVAETPFNIVYEGRR